MEILGLKFTKEEIIIVKKALQTEANHTADFDEEETVLLLKKKFEWLELLMNNK